MYLNTKTHNDGVFDAYTDEMRRARHTGIITGLPDAYGRGRIIGDYRRVPLYGMDYLINLKEALKNYVLDIMNSPVIRRREELSEQIRALESSRKWLKATGSILASLQPYKGSYSMVVFCISGGCEGTERRQ